MPTSFTSTFHAGQRTRSTFNRAMWLVALLICSAVSAAAQVTHCTGPGAPTTTQTKCSTAIAIPGNPIRSFDISWVNPDRAEYYLADRSNAGVDIIDTRHNAFKKTIAGDPNGLHFVGIVLNTAGTAVVNNHSGPDC